MTSDWQKLPLLQGKTIVVTGCASGIGLETARLVTKMGGTVLGVDIKESSAHLTEFYQVDLGDQASIDRLVAALPTGIDGIANIAGLAPTAPADMVVKVNLVGLKQFTLGMINKLNDGASIVNLASLAGEGWPRAIKEIKASENLSLDQVDEFLTKYGISNKKARSYYFSKEALIVWTMQNRWTWRDRGIRINAVSPGPVDTAILPNFLAVIGNEGVAGMTEMDRIGKVADVAPVVAFMLSDMTCWMRGANVPVGGGMLADMMCGRFDL